MNAPLHQIISAIGLPAALKLISRYGGTRIFLPLPGNVTPDNKIAQLIGVEKTRTLATLWAQERPSLPRAQDYLRRERDRAVWADKETHSVPQLALKYQLTERAVYMILAAGDPRGEEHAAAPSPQHDLF